MNTRSIKHLLAVLATATLAACGGGGSDTEVPPVIVVPPVVETPAASKFTQTATWTATLPAAGLSVCYDFNAKAEVAGCAGTAWDIKLKSGAGGRSAEFSTNSGVSGSGTGGAFGSPFTHTWANLLTWKDALLDPASTTALPATAYVADASKNVFTGANAIQSAAFEYDLNGTHQLHPNFRVFLIAADATVASSTGSTATPVFALQVTGYYGGAGGTTSGYPSFRWIDRSDAGVTVKTAQVNASAGWVYYDLASNAVSTSTGTWHIAFNRYNIMLNGSVWGFGGKAGGFVGATPAGFYAGDGTTPVTAKFNATTNLNDTLATLTGALTGPASASAWVKDAIGSQLAPAYTGSYLGPADPAPTPLNYGWFSYYPTAGLATAAGLAGQHMLKANPDNATLVKSGEGTSYARVRLASISYAPVVAPAAPYTGTQTWVIEFGVQPAP